MLSVCIAAYRGERYIGAQLRSILTQLSEDDEVIVVDDCSGDRTCDVILGINDERIRLIRNDANKGISRTFETALSMAKGRIIFISDQDDLWLPNKVERTLAAFESDRELMLLVSDAELIDENGRSIGSSYYANRGRFRPGLWSNLYVCKFLGCTMAFRSDLLARSLPFPRAPEIYHDIWIGCVNVLLKGKTRYLPEPLVAYRRHDSNLTGRNKNSFATRLSRRLQLALALIGFLLSGRSKGTHRLPGPSSFRQS